MQKSTYSSSLMSGIVKAQVASSVAIRCATAWYALEFNLSSNTPCNSKSEYIF